LGLEDPKNLPLERVREIRDDIEKSVERLVRELDAEATAGGASYLFAFLACRFSFSVF
jgi:hypothetical protein